MFLLELSSHHSFHSLTLCIRSVIHSITSLNKPFSFSFVLQHDPLQHVNQPLTVSTEIAKRLC